MVPEEGFEPITVVLLGHAPPAVGLLGHCDSLYSSMRGHLGTHRNDTHDSRTCSAFRGQRDGPATARRRPGVVETMCRRMIFRRTGHAYPVCGCVELLAPGPATTLRIQDKDAASRSAGLAR